MEHGLAPAHSLRHQQGCGALGTELGTARLPLGKPPLQRLLVVEIASGRRTSVFPCLPARSPSRLFPHLYVSLARRPPTLGIFESHRRGGDAENRREIAALRSRTGRRSHHRRDERTAGEG